MGFKARNKSQLPQMVPPNATKTGVYIHAPGGSGWCGRAQGAVGDNPVIEEAIRLACEWRDYNVAALAQALWYRIDGTIEGVTVNAAVVEQCLQWVTANDGSKTLRISASTIQIEDRACGCIILRNRSCTRIGVVAAARHCRHESVIELAHDEATRRKCFGPPLAIRTEHLMDWATAVVEAELATGKIRTIMAHHPYIMEPDVARALSLQLGRACDELTDRAAAKGDGRGD